MLRARELAEEISAGRLTPVQALELGRQNALEKEAALHVYADGCEIPPIAGGPLTGIGIGVKDIFDTADLPSKYGSPIYDGHRPVSDAPMVSMLRGAGATISGKTVTTEFAWFHPGQTRNPHNPDHTPGGSSSGSAAGVAAGYFPAAIGSQTGGSIIRPAAFCGVVGYKPSFRLFPTIGMKCFSWSLDTVGFFAARIEDVSFVAEACSGRELATDPADDHAPRLGVYRSPIDDQADDAMHTAIDQLILRANANGAIVTIVEADPVVEAARAAHGQIQDYEACRSLLHERTFYKDQLSEKLSQHLDEAASISAQEYDDARRSANRARKALRDLFRDVDALILPSAPGAAPPGLGSTGDSLFNRLWTLLGTPCVNLPGMMDSNNMPLGIQVVAPFGADRVALQTAQWLERRIM